MGIFSDKDWRTACAAAETARIEAERRLAEAKEKALFIACQKAFCVWSMPELEQTTK